MAGPAAGAGTAAAALQGLRRACLCPGQRAEPYRDRQPTGRFGIVTTGKSYLDVRQALDALGIDEALALDIELRILKVGMTWPLDAENIRHFAEGLEEILVVEESARSSSTSSRNSFTTGGRMSAPA